MKTKLSIKKYRQRRLFKQNFSGKDLLLAACGQSTDRTIRKVITSGQHIPNGSFTRITDSKGNIIRLSGKSK